MALIGLKNLHYAKINDDNTTATYGTLVKIGNAVFVDINPTVQKAALYGYDMAVATATGKARRRYSLRQNTI